VGTARDTYGTVTGQRTRGLPLDYRNRDEILEHVGGRYLNIVTGDRVVLLEGRDKGKIGKISSTDAKTGKCTVEGLNMVRIYILHFSQPYQ
jgi:large subunit ribosomal protein L24